MKGEQFYYFVSILSFAGAIYPHPVLLGFVMTMYLCIATLMIIASTWRALTIKSSFRLCPEKMIGQAISTACAHSPNGRLLWLIKLLITFVLMYFCGFVYTPFILLVGHVALWVTGEMYLNELERYAKGLLANMKQETTSEDITGEFKA